MKQEQTITQKKSNRAKTPQINQIRKTNSSKSQILDITLKRNQKKANNDQQVSEQGSNDSMLNFYEQQTKDLQIKRSKSKLKKQKRKLSMTPKKEPIMQQQEIRKTNKKSKKGKSNSLKKSKQIKNNKKKNNSYEQSQRYQQANSHNQMVVLKVSVCKKVIIGIIGTLILWLFFIKPANFSGQLKQIVMQEYTPTFQIASLKVSQKIRFQIQNTQLLSYYVPFESTKVAQIQAQVLMRIGYQVQNVQNIIDNDGNENVNVRFSDMKVLSYDIKGYQFNKKQHGFFNKWQIQQVNKIQEYVQQKYIPDVKQKVIQNLNQQQKKAVLKGSQILVEELINKHQTWFVRLIRSINYQFDEIIKQYLPKIMPSVMQKQFIENDVIVFENQDDYDNKKTYNESFFWSIFNWESVNTTQKSYQNDILLSEQANPFQTNKQAQQNDTKNQKQ